MKRLINIYYSLLILFALTASEAFSQVSATGHIIAEIIPVLTATETSQLNFGRFAPGPEGGKIILSPQGSVSVLGSVYKGTGMHNAACFYVTGDQDASFSITLPEKPVILKHLNSPKTMIVDEWVSIPAPGAGTGSLQNGSQTVYVGATLNVGTLNDNPAGIYTGTYEISFDFN